MLMLMMYIIFHLSDNMNSKDVLNGLIYIYMATAFVLSPLAHLSSNHHSTCYDPLYFFLPDAIFVLKIHLCLSLQSLA